jgi:hypothetical protein
MDRELIDLARATVLSKAAPMTIAEIRTAVMKQAAVPSRERFAVEIKAGFSGLEEIHVWPEFNRSARFCSRSLSECVEVALLEALEVKPLTVSQAVAPVKKVLKYVSDATALKEIKRLLPRLASSGRAVKFAANRQTVIYLSGGWMASHSGQPEQRKDTAIASAILQAVARLESGRGNYVRVDHLRLSPELQAVVDEEIIGLAGRGRLVLGRYDGPRPVPDDQRWIYVEDAAGALFIGMALPRPEEA